MLLSRLEPTAVNGCLRLEFDTFVDKRGSFAEAFHTEHFAQAGLPYIWAQDNISISSAMVLRGLHIQRTDPQGKLVRCLQGSIVDVCLDLRKDSPTFKKWHVEELSGNVGLYCPPGTAHGFLATMPDSVVYYKCTSHYHKESDGGVNPFDPDLGMHWSLFNEKLNVSDKDRALPTMDEWLKMGDIQWNRKNNNYRSCQ